jgi:hypothetical protein
MASGYSDGPHTSKPGAARVYRGSRRRIKRITMRDNMSVEFWIFLVLILFLLVGILPWMIRHPHDHHSKISEDATRIR